MPPAGLLKIIRVRKKMMGIVPQWLKKSKPKKKFRMRDVWGIIKNNATTAGVNVTEESSLKYLTVFSCVSLIAGDIARLPLVVYQKSKDNSRSRVQSHPLYDLLHTGPNSEITSFSWRESAQSHLLLWGNSYAEVFRNKYSGDILSIHPIEAPGGVTVKRNRRGIYYEWVVDGLKIIKYRKDILHIPGFGFNGIVGLSMINLAREAVGLGLATESYGSTFFSNGSHPSGIVTLPLEAHAMEEQEEKEYLEALKKQYSGLGKDHQMMVFQNGEKYEQITIPLNDCQFLESRNFQKDEICGMYHVPPHKIAKHGANSNYNNLEQENQNYLDACLTHWTSRWEQTLSHQLLRPDERKKGLYVEFNLSGFLRGDMKARSEFYKTLFQMGYPLNRILSKENENPVEGGDEGFIPLNMIHMNRADDVLALKDSNEANDSGDLNEDPKKTEKKMIKDRSEKRSIETRDRVASQYLPIVERAVEDVVMVEIAEIERRLDERDLGAAIIAFYALFPKIVNDRMAPSLASLADTIRDLAASDMGLDPSSIDIKDFASKYIDGFSNRYSTESQNQLLKLIDEAVEDVKVDIQERLNEWKIKRPERDALNELTRSTNAVFQYSAVAAGYSVVWKTRGKSCDFCKALEGKRVRGNTPFIGKGESIVIDGKKPFVNKGIKRHPPLHKGCDCYLNIN